MSKAWCPLPWISADIRNNGDMRVCNHSQQGRDQGCLRKEDGTAFNAAVDDIDQSRNSMLLREMRQSMLAGEWHPVCTRCQHETESGMLSHNQNETNLWSDVFNIDRATEITAADGSININDVPIMHYGVRFGNKCNIKCRSCGPTESNFWYEDYAAVWNTNVYNESFGQVTLARDDTGRLMPNTKQYEWYESSKFWEHVDKNAANIKHVHTVGGEPTLIDQQYDFLQRCIDLGISHNMIIEYNSNIVKIPPRAWELWPHFKQVRIGASVDGIGDVNDYIRHPSKWHMIEENLDRIDSDQTINFNVWIASTVMIYNIWYIPDMLEWFMRKKFKRIGWTDFSPLVLFHPLYNPKHLSCRALPYKVKLSIAQHFDTRLQQLQALSSELYPDDDARRELISRGVADHLLKWSKFMLHEDQSDALPKFWRYTNKLDEIRNESMSRSLKEFHAILTDTTEL